MTSKAAAQNLTITNPLVLYRSLVASGRIKNDQSQHRLGKPHLMAFVQGRFGVG